MKPTRYKEDVQMNIFDFMGKEADRTLFNLKCIEVDVKGRIIVHDRFVEGVWTKGITKNTVHKNMKAEEIKSFVRNSDTYKINKFGYTIWFKEKNKNWLCSFRFGNLKTNKNETVYEFIGRGIAHELSNLQEREIVYL